jgi:hypothetical protein
LDGRLILEGAGGADKGPENGRLEEVGVADGGPAMADWKEAEGADDGPAKADSGRVTTGAEAMGWERLMGDGNAEKGDGSWPILTGADGGSSPLAGIVKVSPVIREAK